MRTPTSNRSGAFSDNELTGMIKTISEKKLEQSGCVGLWALGIYGLTYVDRSSREYHKLLLVVRILL